MDDADGVAIKAVRERLGLSQQHLAERLGIYQATVSDWERGKKGIRHGRILALALWALEHGAGEEEEDGAGGGELGAGPAAAGGSLAAVGLSPSCHPLSPVCAGLPAVRADSAASGRASPGCMVPRSMLSSD